MKIKDKSECDVLVVGAGLAGIVSAIKAAENGSRVMLISKGRLFSGSSFYPGTWGLGLIAPENEDDTENLADTIIEVGQGIADEGLVREFVRCISPSVRELEKMGLKLKKNEDRDNKDFIPCFDKKHRSWNGILFDNAKSVFSEKLFELRVKTVEFCELVSIEKCDDSISGAVVCIRGEKLSLISCPSVILAAGGFSSLFKDYITTDDVSASVHSLALSSGCELINLEFMQIMPAYVKPCYKTIFNEKAFRFTDMYDENGENLFSKYDISQELIEMRSAYGPFTCEKQSADIDFMIAKHQGHTGVLTSYHKDIKSRQSEFVKTYFDWLYEKKRLTANDDIYLSMFAHASNGGIRIDKNAFTGIKGLFACGEITGGMHGADRIGGLSTANAIVFGLKAGVNASQYAGSKKLRTLTNADLELFSIKNREEAFLKARSLMSENCLVIRNGKRLENALSELDSLRESLQKHTTDNIKDAIRSRALLSRLILCECIVKAQLLRKESRGSHYRDDFKEHNDKLKKNITVCKAEGRIKVSFDT